MYKSLNDYEILYMIEEENNNFNYLYSKYYPLICNYVKNFEKFFKKYGYELDDLLQIGYITLYKASRLYSETNSAKFYTYFKTSLKNALFSEMKINNTLKKEVLNNALSYDAKVKNTDISYLELIPCKEENKNDDIFNLVIRMKSSMPYEMSWIFELFYNGYNIDEISILLDKEKKVVSRYFREIKSYALTYKYLFLH